MIGDHHGSACRQEPGNEFIPYCKELPVLPKNGFRIAQPRSMSIDILWQSERFPLLSLRGFALGSVLLCISELHRWGSGGANIIRTTF